MAGIEALIGTAVARAGTVGVVRAATWGASKLFESRKRKKIRALLATGAPPATIDALEKLSTSDTDAISRFCESPEIFHCATMLARSRLVEGTGKKAEQFSESIKTELSYSLALYLGSPPDEAIVNLLFSALDEAVSRNIKQLKITDVAASTKLDAEIVKTIAGASAASLRNTEILRGFSKIEQVNSFADELRSQAVAVHGNMRLPHAGTTRQVPYELLYVQSKLWIPDLSVRVRRASSTLQTSHDHARFEVSDIDVVLRNCNRAVVLGDPGGGKSTLSRRFVYMLAAEHSDSAPVPFYVELRDYAKTFNSGAPKQTFVEYLEGVCRLPYNVDPPENAVEFLLLNDRAVVIFDGLDELLDTSLRREVAQVVEAFAHKYPTCRLLVTSRRVGYDEAPLDPDLFWSVELGDFSDNNVEDYVKKWFDLDESIDTTRKTGLVEAFISDSHFVADLRVNPLMLSLMCGIYASENYIPRNRPDVYEKCSLLLFERWDKQRGIQPALSFDAHVQAAMRSLALYMFSESNEAQLPKAKLISYLKEYLLEKRFEDEDTAENAAQEFIDFCKGRAWVLTDIGSDTYGFTHRTFLEYFAASQLVRKNSSAAALFSHLRDRLIAGEWDVVAQLSLQILGKQVEDGIDDFLDLALACYHQIGDAKGSGLLSFTIRSLSFAVPRPAVLQAICDAAIDAACTQKPTDSTRRIPSQLSFFRNTSAENVPRIFTSLRRSIEIAIANGRSDELVSIAAFHAPTYGGSLRFSNIWTAWTVENRTQFDELFERVKHSVWWVGMILFEEGQCSAPEIIRDHGLSAFYKWVVDGAVSAGPFYWRAAHGHRGKSYAYRGIIAPISTLRGKQLLSNLDRCLDQMANCRVRYCIELSHLVGYLGIAELDKVGGPAFLLLSLPIIEANAEYVSKERAFKFERDLDGYASDLYALRRGMRSDIDEVLSKFNSLALSPHVQEVLRKWALGEHSFIYGRKVRARLAKEEEGAERIPAP